MYDYTVFIGRFQPFHFGHIAVIRQALAKSKKLIILVGSANRARDIRNPFSFAERVEMVTLCLTDAERTRIFFAPLADFMYQDTAWVENVQRIVFTVVHNDFRANMTHRAPNIALIGHSKDATGFFLKMFPQWESIDVTDAPPINATDIRKIYFGNQPLPVENYLPKQVYDWMADWRWSKNEAIFNTLQKEFDHVVNYKKQFAGLKYPPIHHTVDALVEQSGHVLLIKRGALPGEGLWALPGGFLEQDEFLIDGAIRELYQETKIDVPEKVLRGCIVNEHTFDDPHRSTRGRTITHTIHIRLEDRNYLPKIKTKQSLDPKDEDDAKEAKWVSWAQWKCENTFEDHWFQGQYFKR